MLQRQVRGQLEVLVCGSLRDLIPDDHVLARIDRAPDLPLYGTIGPGGYSARETIVLAHRHTQVTTTKERAAIQESDEVGTALAEHFGVTPQTIYEWRDRDTVEDHSHMRPGFTAGRSAEA